MKLTTLSLSLIALISAPLASSIPVADATGPACTSPQTVGSQTYDTSCGFTASEFSGFISSGSANNFFSCLKMCSYSSKKALVCCGGVNFDLPTKMCSLYASVTGMTAQDKSKVGVVTSTTNNCGTA